VLILHHYPSSVCAQKVRLVLEEKRLDWTPVVVDIHAGEQFRPAYLRLNPAAVVPTLEHDGNVIVESTVINEYLEDAFPDTPQLRPGDPVAQARMRLWTQRLDGGLHQACGMLTGAANAAQRADTIRRSGLSVEAYLAGIPDKGRRDRLRIALEQGPAAPAVLEAVRHYAATLAAMDEALAAGPWLAGSEYSLADAGVTPYVERLLRLGMAELFERHARVHDWYLRVRARPSHERAIARFDVPERIAALHEGGTAAWRELAPRLAA